MTMVQYAVAVQLGGTGPRPATAHPALDLYENTSLPLRT
jgi:hypothetical protein